MLAFILRRLLLMVPTTLGMALVVFSLYHVVPGDPATVALGNSATGELSAGIDMEARVEAFRRRHGLDRSLVVQFLNYIGPFNLMRDGHPWFSSPYSERKADERRLEDGTTVVEGAPLPIGVLPSTSPVERQLGQELARDLGAGSRSVAEVEPQLGQLGEHALPFLLSELERGAGQYETQAERSERLLSGLSIAAQREDPPADPARGLGGRVAAWFGWYYRGPGARVPNTGERPWGGLLVLDLGREMQRRTPVAPELWKRLQVTLPLSAISVLLSYLIALPLGIFSARRHGTRSDAWATVSLFVLYSIPTFWAGLMLIILFGRTGLGWLPVLGLTSPDHGDLSTWGKLWDVVSHCILPVVTMTYASLAYLSRQMRAGLLDAIHQDYIRTARAKGLPERTVIYKHALRNSLIPVITLFASILPILVGGSVVVEQIFDLPGMGKYAYEGLLQRDFSVVMATTLFVGVMTQLGILLSDVAYSWVDPRIRHA